LSIWHAGSGAFNEFKNNGFRKWPSPFDGMMKDIEVLACQDTWQAKVTMYGIGFGNWFYSNFIPSPVEITRKTITGSYKCGFYFKTKFGSPIDVVWKNEKISQMLLEISNPFTTALFYMWAGQTFFSFLDVVQTIAYAQAKCGTEHDECLLVDGEGLYFAGGASLGTPGFYTELQDVKHMYQSPGGDVEWHEPGNLRSNAFGTVYAGSANISHCVISFMKGTTILGGEGNSVNLGAIPAGGSAQWALSFSGGVDAGTLRINGDIINDAVGLQRSTLFVNRWTTGFTTDNFPHNCTPWPVKTIKRSGDKHWWIPQ